MQAVDDQISASSVEALLPPCYRQANRCADLMARLGADQELEYILFSSLPMDLAKALEDDCMGVSFNRLCTELDVMF